MTQAEAVYTYLRSHPEGLTPLEALREPHINSLRLAAVVYKVKRDYCTSEEEIVNLGFTTESGKHVARYVLQKRGPSGQATLPW